MFAPRTANVRDHSCASSRTLIPFKAPSGSPDYPAATMMTGNELVLPKRESNSRASFRYLSISIAYALFFGFLRQDVPRHPDKLSGTPLDSGASSTANSAAPKKREADLAKAFPERGQFV